MYSAYDGLLRLGLVRVVLPFLLKLLLVVIAVFAFCGFVLLVLVLEMISLVSVPFSVPPGPSLSSRSIATMTIAWLVFSSCSSSSSSSSFASCSASCLDLYLRARF